MLRTLLSVLAMAILFVGVSSAQDLVINEIYYDGPGTDEGTFTEIKGPGGFDLTGYTLVGVNGSNGEDYRTISLDGMVIPADGYVVIAQDETVANYDYIDSGVDWQNGPDELELRLDPDVIDGICYGYSELLNCEGGTNGPDVSSGSSISRCPDGVDTNNNEDDTTETTPTPGETNACGIEPPVEMTLCEAVALDGEGFPVNIDVYVHITSPLLVLTNDGTYSVDRVDLGATDGECCVNVFDFDYYVELNEGDEIDLTGTVAFYNGKVEISGPSLEIGLLSSGNPLPEPENISTEELAINGNDYESCLIMIDNLYITGGDPWPPEGSNANIEITDDSGIPTTMRIDKETNIDGSDPPEEPFTCIGIGGQYDNSAPYDSGFQILPRYLDDIISTPLPEHVCCVGELCYITTQPECVQMGGEWHEEWDECDPNPCIQSPTQETSWGEIKSIYR